MGNSFGGMSDDEFFLGDDTMIDEDDLDSINYDPREYSGSNNNRAYYGGGYCCVAILPILIIVVVVLSLIF